jgi:hypothetical protein
MGMDLFAAIAERRRELEYRLMKLDTMRRKPVFLEGVPEYRDRLLSKLSR